MCHYAHSVMIMSYLKITVVILPNRCLLIRVLFYPFYRDPNLPRPQLLQDIHREYIKSDFKYDKIIDGWPEYGPVVQYSMHIGSSPRRKEAYRLHKIAFWEELVPGVQSHFIPENTYIVDPNPPPKTKPNTPTSTNEIPDPHATPNPGSSGKQREKSFMVELSMVIACGGFLLLLNVIVLGGIYYLRDKRKLEAKLAAKYLAQQEEKKRQDNKSDLSDDRPITMNHAPSTGTHSNHSGMSMQSYMRHDFLDGEIEFEV